MLQIVRDLLCGSGGRKGSWKTEQYNRFVLAKGGQIVLFGRKAVMQFYRRHHVSDRGKGTEGMVGNQGCKWSLAKESTTASG